MLDRLSFLLACKQITIRIDDESGEWVWCEELPDRNVIVHGSPPYSREDAHEDALRHLCDLPSIADSIKG